MSGDGSVSLREFLVARYDDLKRRLAQRLQLPFVDSDHVIEDRIGCSIRDYFEREGEASFRDIEEAVIADLASVPHGVVATGGGSVLRESNRSRLRANFHVIYLRSSPEDLFSRLRHDVKRPLLQVEDPLGRLRELHDAVIRCARLTFITTTIEQHDKAVTVFCRFDDALGSHGYILLTVLDGTDEYIANTARVLVQRLEARLGRLRCQYRARRQSGQCGE